MTAHEAYRLIQERLDNGFRSRSCREYRSFFMFFAGGINVICVDKRSGKVEVSELRQMPNERWKIIEF